ncbi:DUF3298 and DUF4163 domain-containing protein [Bacteroidaceae bacterium HV4-6-C5C]|jgi:hypothetical protein|nr:DUF3298 and DUF4163 domain-containing protein [Bacteroidaceae bacterium HV4-6-C5C]
MKKQYVSLLTLFFTVCIFFVSCTNKGDKNAGNLNFDSIQVNKTVHLFGDTAKPGCNLIINFQYIIKSTDKKTQDSLNTIFLSACLGDTFAILPPKTAIQKYTQKYVTDYRRDLEPMYKKDEADNEDKKAILSWYSYYKNVEGHVQLYQKSLLVYRVDYSEYTGGAHGMYSSTFYNIDLKTLRPLHLDDLFEGEDYKEALTDLLWNQLMTDNKVATHQALEDMGYTSTGDLEPTENFYLSKYGITFFYNVYEITPYAMGTVKITLPYEVIDRLLKKEQPILKEIK